jgi:hypothetical protein
VERGEVGQQAEQQERPFKRHRVGTERLGEAGCSEAAGGAAALQRVQRSRNWAGAEERREEEEDSEMEVRGMCGVWV